VLHLIELSPEVWVDATRLVAVEQGLGNFAVVHLATGGEDLRLSLPGVTVEDVVDKVRRWASQIQADVTFATQVIPAEVARRFPDGTG
jgi:hypothetical protein